MTGRFSRLPAAAVTDTALSDKTLRVLAVLGIYADAGGLAYPSIPSVAKHLRMSERQIRRHVRALEAAGYVATERTIRHTRGGWGRNRYFIQYPAVVLPAAPAEDCDEDVGGVPPSGIEAKRTSGHRSGNEAIGHPECPVGDERPDIQGVRSGRDFDEATGHLEPSDRTSRVSDTTGHPGCPINSPLIPISPMGNQPKGSRDVFEEMFSELLPALRRQSSVDVEAITIETGPAEPKLLGKVMEPTSNVVPIQPAPAPIQPAPAPKKPWRKPVIEFYQGTDVYWSNRFAKAKTPAATQKVNQEFAGFLDCTDAERRGRWPEAFAPCSPAEPPKAPTLNSPSKFAAWLDAEMNALAVDAETLGTATGLGGDGIKTIRAGKATITSTTRGKILAALDTRRRASA